MDALDNNGSGSDILTLAVSTGSPAITVNNGTATISAVLAGSAGLTVDAPAALNFTGSLFNNGATLTSALAAGTLTLNPAAVENYTGATTVNNAVLALNFSNLSTPVNLINSGSALTLAGAGLAVVDKTGAVATSQSFAGLTLSPGPAAISVNSNGNTNAASTLALGAISRSAGSNVNFILPAMGSITTTTANLPGTGMMGGWATVNAVNTVTWAVSGGDGTNPGAISGLPAAAFTANTLGPAINTSLTSTVSISSDTSTNSVYLNTTNSAAMGQRYSTAATA